MSTDKAAKDSSFVSRETFERLELYESLVRKWQKSINLVAPSTLADTWTRHIEDSLQLVKLVRTPLRWADLGSGAGFPGLVTAIVLIEQDDGWVHLVESNNKKAAFLRDVIRATGARASVHAGRIEQVLPTLDGVEAISARALAPLSELFILASPLLLRDGVTCWFHKGLDYASEVRSARDRWTFDLVEHPSGVQDGSVILEIRSVRSV